ncbi:hypothetical protein D7V93_27525 [Corallococcus llansteffanensis]|uniref:Uncharacterized protein n=1 Tax=Corallococcus llansteffanensis TaxID=2316731 RepID=A0A3A8P914_9BACT|nr:hypothetical protein D7V93_27525 [Corallococcus llansteffanensis]
MGLGLLGAWACTTGSAPADTARVEEKPMASRAQASVEVFSGREPPTWALAPDESRALREAVEALPVGTRSRPDVGLGYRGFTVTWEDGARATVYRDVVEYAVGGRTQVREDASRAVEERLLLGSRAHLDPELFTAVASQVQAAQP